MLCDSDKRFIFYQAASVFIQDLRLDDNIIDALMDGDENGFKEHLQYEALHSNYEDFDDTAIWEEVDDTARRMRIVFKRADSKHNFQDE